MTEQLETQTKTTNIVKFLNIHPKFSKACDPLIDEEFQFLEKLIIERGVREPLIIWQGYIIDGHHRYKICCKHGLEFPTVEYPFEDEDHALQHIHENQLGKRNILPFRRVEHVKIAEELKLKREAKKNQIRKPLSETKKSVLPNLGEQIIKPPQGNRVDDQLAEKSGVGHATVHKASKLIDFADEATKQELREGKKSIDRAYREMKTQEMGCKERFPQKKFRVFYADFYEKDSLDGWTPIENFSDLKAIPIKEFQDEKGAVCFLWTPIESLYSTILVMQAWGFGYCTCFSIESDRKVEGLYNSCDHLIVVVGDSKYGCIPDGKNKISSILEDKVTIERRVLEFRKIIDEMYCYGKKIQLFSDSKTSDWDIYQ